MENPKEGDIIEGKVYMGGDPSEVSSWLVAPKQGDVIEGKTYKGGNPFEASSWAEGQSQEMIDESTPNANVSFKERALIKNFGVDNNQSMQYLSKQHPDMSFTEIDGNIYGRKGNESWTPVDPKGFLAGKGILGKIKELGKDVVDVGYDVASGAGETAAAVAAGLPTGGAAAIPTAMAASAASEGIRQTIGKALGIAKEGSTGDVLMAGAAGGALPVLGGVGKALYKGAKGTGKWLVESAVGDEKIAKELMQIAGKASEKDVSREALGKTTEMIADDLYNMVSKKKEEASALYNEVSKKADELGMVADVEPIKGMFDKLESEVSTLEGGGSDKLVKTIRNFRSTILEPFKEDAEVTAKGVLENYFNPYSQVVEKQAKSPSKQIESKTYIDQLYRMRDEAEEVITRNKQGNPQTRRLVEAAQNVKEHVKQEVQRLEQELGVPDAISKWKEASELEDAVKQVLKDKSSKVRDITALSSTYDSGHPDMIDFRMKLSDLLGEDADKKLSKELTYLRTLRTVSDADQIKLRDGITLPDAASTAAKFGAYSWGIGAAGALAAAQGAKKSSRWLAPEGTKLLKSTKSKLKMNESLKNVGSKYSKYAPVVNAAIPTITPTEE